MNELRSSDTSIQKVGKIIAKDVGMTAKILQMVNSAFFGLPRHVSSPAQAASLLGLDTVKALVLSVQIFSQFDQTKTHGIQLGDPLEALHGRRGVTAKKIADAADQERKMIDDSLDGRAAARLWKSLCWAANFPEKFSSAMALSRVQRAHPVGGGAGDSGDHTHAEIGAYLMGLWGLPGADRGGTRLSPQPFNMQRRCIHPAHPLSMWQTAWSTEHRRGNRAWRTSESMWGI